MKTATAHVRYNSIVLLIGLGLLLMVGLFNALVDPFSLTRIIEIKGFNAVKAGTDDSHQRLAKALHLWTKPVGSVLLGSSATAVGLSPGRVAWISPEGPPAYNAGLPGANMYEIRRYYEHAAHVSEAGDYVLGLEFMSFIFGDAPVGNFSESWLAVSASGQVQPPWFYELPAALFSLPALEASWQTILKQDQGYAPYSFDGSRPTKAMAARNKRMGGHRSAFESMQKWRPSYQMRGDASRSLQRNLAHFEKLVRAAYAAGHKLRIFFSPRHAWSLEAHAQQGRWELLEHWKRSIVEIVEHEAGTHTPYPVWDFNTFNDFTTEPLPPAQEPDATMRWHWEWSHYKQQLGDRVLSRIAEPACRNAPSAEPALFGVCLESSNIDAHLRESRDARMRYNREHPQLARTVSAAIVGNSE